LKEVLVETAVQAFAVINLATIGVSHIVAPRAWVEFFTMLRERHHAGVFAVAFMSLWFGSVIVAFHNVWSGIPVVLTVLGWGQVLKGVIYFLFPDVGLRRISMVTQEKAAWFRYGGWLFVVIAGVLLYHLVAS
jgi:hypothetical protein